MAMGEQSSSRDAVSAPRTIQVVVSEDGDERALRELLGDEYEVITDANLQSVDCYLLDDRTLLAYHDEYSR